jgi:hypothetical protein
MGMRTQTSATDLKGNVMPSISPLIVRLFDDPHADHRRGGRERDAKRSRFESRGRVARAKRS